jgi:ribose-phosphate pyrophosphokinase
MDTPVVFSTQRYLSLGDALVREGGFERGAVETRLFPDGERYTRVVTPVHGRDAIALGGTISDYDTLELYDLACGIVQCGARTITLAVPYFGCSTMERATQPGEVVTAKTRARLLSTVPIAYHANQVLLLDLHTEGIAHYFEGDVHAVHLTAKGLVAAAARELAGDDFVVGSTDAGRAKMVQEIANDLGVPASFIFKQRLSGSRTEVKAISAHVAGRTVVIYDDMIRTGGSLVGAARAYQEAGAARLIAIATHGVLPGDSLERIRAAGLFERVVCTDSHPRAVELACDFLQVKSVAPVFASHIARS